eukprot:935916_1
MGSNVSCECIESCTCFVNDKRIENVNIVRYLSYKWTWTKYHQSTLVECLHNQSRNGSIDLINVIKSYLFPNSNNQTLYTSKAIIYNEKHYPMNKLLNKKLCYQWCKSNLSILGPLSIAVVATNRTMDQLLCGLNKSTDILPALQPKKNPAFTVRHTVYIDNSQIRLNLIHSTVNYPKNCQVIMVVLGKNNSINEGDKVINKLMNTHKYKSKCFVLVKLLKCNSDKNAIFKFEENQLCRKYNLP